MPDSSSHPESDDAETVAARFHPTRWSMVLSAAGRGGAGPSRQSLEELCAAYWKPLYAFLRRQGESPHDAQDLTQEFFARFIEKDFLRGVDPARGRFRSYLLACLKHFAANERDKVRAQKRGGGRTLLPLDFDAAEGRLAFQPVDKDTPEKAFEKNWALALLDQALARLRRDYEAQGNAELFTHLKSTLTDGSAGNYAELGARLGRSEAAMKMAAHRLKQRYKEAVRLEIAETVADDSEIEEELRHVLRSVSD